METRDIRIILAGLGALLVLLAIVTPWWTVSFAFSSSGGFGMGPTNGDGQESAGPFDDGEGVIAQSQATVAGLFGLVALGALLAVMVFGILERADALSLPPVVFLATAAGAAFFIVLAAILAATTWPEDMGFWDSDSGSANGFSTSVEAYGAVGWYFAVVAGAVAIAVAVMSVLPAPRVDNAPQAV